MPAPDPGSDGFKNIKGRGVIKTKIKKMTIPDRGIDMSDNKGGGKNTKLKTMTLPDRGTDSFKTKCLPDEKGGG